MDPKAAEILKRLQGEKLERPPFDGPMATLLEALAAALSSSEPARETEALVASLGEHKVDPKFLLDEIARLLRPRFKELRTQLEGLRARVNELEEARKALTQAFDGLGEAPEMRDALARALEVVPGREVVESLEALVARIEKVLDAPTAESLAEIGAIPKELAKAQNVLRELREKDPVATILSALEEGARLAAKSGHRGAADLWLRRAALGERLGKVDLTAYEAALAAAEQTGRSDVAARAALRLQGAALAASNLPRVAELSRRVTKIAVAANDLETAVRSQLEAALVEGRNKHFEQAFVEVTEARARAGTDARLLARADYVRGELLELKGEAVEAVHQWRKILKVASVAPASAGRAAFGIGRLAGTAKRPHEEAKALRLAIELGERANDFRLLEVAYVAELSRLRESGQAEEADKLLASLEVRAAKGDANAGRLARVLGSRKRAAEE